MSTRWKLPCYLSDRHMSQIIIPFPYHMIFWTCAAGMTSIIIHACLIHFIVVFYDNYFDVFLLRLPKTIMVGVIVGSELMRKWIFVSWIFFTIFVVVTRRRGRRVVVSGRRGRRFVVWGRRGRRVVVRGRRRGAVFSSGGGRGVVIGRRGMGELILFFTSALMKALSFRRDQCWMTFLPIVLGTNSFVACFRALPWETIGSYCCSRSTVCLPVLFFLFSCAFVASPCSYAFTWP